MLAFSEAYQTGQHLSLRGGNGEPVTEAFVIDYDPSSDRWVPSNASKATTRPSPNHWHIAVRNPTVNEWLPAAIWQTRDNQQGRFGVHLTRRQLWDERLDSQAVTFAYPSAYLQEIVGGIALDVVRIVTQESEGIPQ